jgi:LPPG:FO 2-phospho-L-lactate transferase
MKEFDFSKTNQLKVTVLAGGVGGAKLTVGLDRILPPGNLTVIVNTGDDFTHFGLRICPDLDTVCYSLAGLANKTYGWGLESETWNVADALEALGAPTWFQLGDRDLALHMERTRLLTQGKKLSEVTADMCRRWGISSKVLPMSDDESPTLIETQSGEVIAFQDYLVKHRAEPEVKSILLHGFKEPNPLNSVIDAIYESDLVVIAPSNPWVSIDPILELEGIREALKSRTVVAVSPIIQGKAIKGPAAKMFSELGIEPSSLAVMKHYQDILDLFVYDLTDEPISKSEIPDGLKTFQLQTIMSNEEDKIQLARQILDVLVGPAEEA